MHLGMKQFTRKIHGLEDFKSTAPFRKFSLSKFRESSNKIPVAANSQAKQNLQLNPWFVTGFTDGEGSFSIIMVKSSAFKLQWQTRLYFQISVHVKDKILLEQIQNFFGVGKIYPKTSDSIIYSVKSIKDLTVIVNHFEKYPLITQKWADYYLWKQAFTLVNNKEHLNLEGLKKIVAYKSAINWGLPEELRTAFPVSTIQKPVAKAPETLDPHWLAGFVSGDGNFSVEISNQVGNLTGAVRLAFRLVQHSKDKELMKFFISYLDCGNSYDKLGSSEYRVRKFPDIKEKIIPFFRNYPIQGVKSLDFEDFCLVCEILQEDKKLTPDNFAKICQIKSGMNRGRILSSS